jgi:hypothetical protein
MTSNIMPEDYKKMTDQEIKDCTEYDILYRQSKLLFPEVEPFILDIAVLAYFKNGCKDVWPKPDYNMVKEMKRMYNNEPTVYKSVEVIDNPTIIE